MFRCLPCVLFVSLFVYLFPLSALGQEKKAKPNASAPIHKLNQASWKARHEKFLAQTKKGGIEVVFLGDSITHGWESAKARKGETVAANDIWKKEFGAYKPGNYGIGGDQTGHVIWRVTEGKELDGLSPKVAVIMIGTNNMGGYSADQIAGGVETLVKKLRDQKPKMKILVLGIFPRSAKATDSVREKIKKTNEQIAKLADDKTVFYKDIGEKFLEKDGSLSPTVMYDYLHLTGKGYQIWADAIRDDLAKHVKE